MFLNKSIASRVATKVTEKYKEIEEAAKAAFEAEIIAIYLKTLPAEVLKFAAKFPKFVNTTSCIRVATNGGHKTHYLAKTVAAQNGSDRKIKLSAKASNLQKQAEEARKNYDALWHSVRDQILQFRTLKRLQENFPEAAALVDTNPAKKVEPLTLKSIREKIAVK